MTREGFEEPTRICRNVENRIGQDRCLIMCVCKHVCLILVIVHLRGGISSLFFLMRSFVSLFSHEKFSLRTDRVGERTAVRACRIRNERIQDLAPRSVTEREIPRTREDAGERGHRTRKQGKGGWGRKGLGGGIRLEAGTGGGENH